MLPTRDTHGASPATRTSVRQVDSSAVTDIVHAARTWVAALDRVALLVAEELDAGHEDELNEDERLDVKRHWRAKVGGCAAVYRPQGRVEPVAEAQKLDSQAPQDGEHGPAAVDELRLGHTVELLLALHRGRCASDCLWKQCAGGLGM